MDQLFFIYLFVKGIGCNLLPIFSFDMTDCLSIVKSLKHIRSDQVKDVLLSAVIHVIWVICGFVGIA